MNWNDVAAAAGPLLLKNAPMIGGVLGGFIPIPGGSAIGSEIGSVMANAFGVPNTPEAVSQAINSDPKAAEKLQAAESEANTKWPALAAIAHEDTESFKVSVADVQSARSSELALVEAKSPIQWAPIVLSIIVVVGFQMISYLAITRNSTAVDRDVMMFLLGAWSSAFSATLNYWLGSSAGSKNKDSALASALGNSQVQTATAAATTAAVVKKNK